MALERNGELRLNFGIGESRADAVRILASYGLVVGEDNKVWGPDPSTQSEAAGDKCGSLSMNQLPTAARTNDVLGATWAEIDLNAAYGPFRMPA